MPAHPPSPNPIRLVVLQPEFETVVEQVANGGGGVPAFGDELGEQEIRDVAAFVTENAGG